VAKNFGGGDLAPRRQEELRKKEAERKNVRKPGGVPLSQKKKKKQKGGNTETQRKGQVSRSCRKMLTAPGQ